MLPRLIAALQPWRKPEIQSRRNARKQSKLAKSNGQPNSDVQNDDQPRSLDQLSSLYASKREHSKKLEAVNESRRPKQKQRPGLASTSSNAAPGRGRPRDHDDSSRREHARRPHSDDSREVDNVSNWEQIEKLRSRVESAHAQDKSTGNHVDNGDQQRSLLDANGKPIAVRDSLAPNDGNSSPAQNSEPQSTHHQPETHAASTRVNLVANAFKQAKLSLETSIKDSGLESSIAKHGYMEISELESTDQATDVHDALRHDALAKHADASDPRITVVEPDTSADSELCDGSITEIMSPLGYKRIKPCAAAIGKPSDAMWIKREAERPVNTKLDKMKSFVGRVPEPGGILAFHDPTQHVIVANLKPQSAFNFSGRDTNARKSLKPLLYPRNVKYDRTHLIPFGFHGSESNSMLVVGWDGKQNRGTMNDYEQNVKRLNSAGVPILWCCEIIRNANAGAKLTYACFSADTLSLLWTPHRAAISKTMRWSAR